VLAAGVDLHVRISTWSVVCSKYVDEVNLSKILTTAAKPRWVCSAISAKPTNIDQRIVAQKSMLVTIIAPSTGK
jgi:hypothetical protein